MFAAGTLGDKTFGFQKLDRMVGGRHGNYRREDTGSAHNVGEDSCTPFSEEFDNRLGAWLCDEEYMEAV